MPKPVLHIYSRVSSAIQGTKGTSVEDQIRLGKKYAKTNGFAVKEWKEGVASAAREDLSNRPVMVELLEATKLGLVENIYVFATDRFSRDETTSWLIRSVLMRHKVVVHTNSGTVDFDKPTDKLLYGVLSEIAQYENTLRRERSRIGKLSRVKAGGWLGGPAPFGYQVVDRKLALHPEESKWVLKMFLWAADGESLQRIQTKLGSAGVETRRKRGFWSIGSIRAVLRNTHSQGHYKYTDKKSGEVVVIKNADLRCVPESVYLKVQERFAEHARRRRSKAATKTFYLLNDFLECGGCGNPMPGRYYQRKNSSGVQNQYRCVINERRWKKGAIPNQEKWQRGRLCSMNRSVHRPTLDALVWQAVIDTVGDSSILKAEVKERVLGGKFIGEQESEDLVKKEMGRRKKLLQQIKRLEEIEADAEYNFLTGETSKSAYQKVKARLKADRLHIEAQMEQSKLHQENAQNTKKWVDWIAAHEASVEELKDYNDKQKHEYLKTQLRRIVVELTEDKKHRVHIEFRLPIVQDTYEYTDRTTKPMKGQAQAGMEWLELPAQDLRGSGGWAKADGRNKKKASTRKKKVQ